MINNYIWIKTDQELADICEFWANKPVLALDTEFVRTETFHAIIGLIQVCVDEQTWLVDPLGISAWKPFADVLVDESITKVFHSLSEDAEVLKHSVGVLVNNVFDSQIAAGFLGYPVQMSYAKLVESLFDLEIGKEETRSDWTKRPLNENQCLYAAADVYWLFKAYGEFSQQLKSMGRYEWVIEDSNRVVQNNMPVDPQTYYLKLRGGWKLKGVSLQILKDLAAWREQNARQLNVNRGRIMQDKELISIAEVKPMTKATLQNQLKLHARKIRLYGDNILAIVKQAETVSRQDWPERIDGPLPSDQAELLKSVRSEISLLAESHNVPVELLARRKALESWLRSGCRTGQYELPEMLSGWRKPILLEPVTELLMAQWNKTNEA